jgi:hypothetical protein
MRKHSRGSEFGQNARIEMSTEKVHQLLCEEARMWLVEL